MSSPSPGPAKSPDDLLYPQNDNESCHINQKCQCNEKIRETIIIENSKTEQSLHPQLKAISTSHHHHSTHGLNLAHTHSINQLSQIPQISCSTHNIVQNLQSSPRPASVTKLSNQGCSCHLQVEEGRVKSEEAERSEVRKFEADDRIEISPLPPALPPRPPPRPRFDSSLSSRYNTRLANSNTGESKKYVFCCTVCGGLVTVLGSLFLTVYFLLRSLTSTLNYFETIPTFVPASMLIFTGILILILSKRKYRNNYLIKVGGLCCLICALTCVLVTITTTVIHMNRLQTLRECVYTKKTRTCTCYSILLEAQSTADEGMRFVFDSTPDCEVIHGELYVCLRMMFGISVTGILVCIFSCMLMYQLLSHEKKKMYWEQLEMRCRSFYQQHSNPPGSAHGSVREPTIASTIYCSCCEECRYPPLPIGPQVYPWDTHNSTDRFWTPGRIGNFYSPNPGDLPSGDSQARNRAGNGWSWRRFPWGRNSGGQTEIPRDPNSFMYQGVASSADSQYGFTTRGGGNEGGLPRDPISGSSDSYSMLDNRPPLGGVYVWGPPPPYSNPNSPARRVFHSPGHRYQHIHHHPIHSHESHCQMSSENPGRNSRRSRPYTHNKQNYENTTETEVHQNNDNSESTDTSSCLERISHTLPVRKMKKRAELASVKSIYHQGSSSKVNVQSVFMQTAQDGQNTNIEEHSYTEPNLNENIDKPNKAEPQKCRFLPRLQGVENPTFQKQETSPQKAETAESEVYFADVSSCCNISVRNDGQDSSLYDEALENQKTRIDNNNQCLQNPASHEDEDYLVHRMGSRQMSVRSRMPIPLPENEDLTFPNNEPCLQLLTKDISQNSLCSSVQSPMTETTDDAITPTECCTSYFATENVLESPKNRKFSVTDQYLAPDAQYEIVQNQEEFRPNTSNLTNTISGLNNFGPNYYNQSKKFNYLSPNGQSSKPTGGSTIACRKNTGCNITNLIQNLGSNSGGLLYGEASAGEEEIQGQSCHSDGTMDSGWQSGSEKLSDLNKKNEEHPPNQ